MGEHERDQGIAAYLRVSSRAQDVASQRAAIERCAAARGHNVATWHEEKLTGRALDRPVLNLVREAVRRGEIRTLYVYRLDRITRSGIRDTLAVLDEFRAYNCALVTVADAFSLDGPAAEIVIAALSWAAQLERQKIGENIANARIRVESKGGRWGRPPRVPGDQVAQIRELHSAGWSVRRISMSTKVCRSTVSAVLSGKGCYSDARGAAEIAEVRTIDRGSAA